MNKSHVLAASKSISGAVAAFLARAHAFGAAAGFGGFRAVADVDAGAVLEEGRGRRFLPTMKGRVADLEMTRV